MGILVIDHDPKDLDFITRSLLEMGFLDIHSCNGADAARELLGITDLQPRILFGLELIVFDFTQDLSIVKDIRESSYYEDIPMLMVADGSREDRLKTAFGFGAADFISKPIHNFELKARVHSCLRLRHEIDRRKARERELIEATHNLSDLNLALSRVSLIDSLTTIPNRRCFDQSLDQEWRRCYRSDENLSILMIDVDYFKQFNDTYGHQRGDSCLCSIAKAIRSNLKRPGDILARYGGEEFVIILPNTDEKSAVIVAETILRGISDLKLEHKSSEIGKFVTVSVGVASVHPRSFGGLPDEIVGRADKALYNAKKSGRNRFMIFDSSSVKAA